MERVLFLIFASLLFFASTTAMLDKDCEETASVQNCQEGYELVNSFMKERRCWINKCRKCPEIEIGCSFGSLGFERNSCTLRCKPHPCDVAKCPPGNGCRISYRTQNGTREYYSKCYVRDRFCFQPKSDGYCGQNVTRYYYNDDVKDCLPLQSSECGESKNNHASLDSCRKRCYGYRCRLLKCVACPNGYEYDDKDCQTCTCSRPYKVCPLYKCRVCEFGYKKDKYGCQTCDCLEPFMPSKCFNEPGDTKIYNYKSPRYLYDPSIKSCKPALYGQRHVGFKALDECSKVCMGRIPQFCANEKCNGTCTRPVFTSDGCFTCECSEENYCENVKCADMHTCRIQKQCKNGVCENSFQCVNNGFCISPWRRIQERIKNTSTRGLIAIAVGFGLALTAIITTIVFIIKVIQKGRRRRYEKPRIPSISTGKYKNLKNEIKVPLA